MQKLVQYLSAERSASKIAGIFNSQSDAQSLVDSLRRVPTLGAWQIRLLGPQDARRRHHEWFSASVEPEPKAIGRTLVWTHVVLGMVGAAIGLALYWWLYARGQPMVLSSPWLSLIAITGFATTFGLLAGGLVALRPDHIRLIQWIRSALRSNQWVVVVHPTDAEQLADAERLLKRDAVEAMQTL